MSRSNNFHALRRINAGIVFACMIGLGLSYYAYMVEVKKEEDETYEPLCDISEHVSCTKVFMTEYGKGFGLLPKDSIFNVPNSVYGLMFYSLVTILSMFNNYTYSVAVVILGILSDICSIYLAHILYMLKDICVVCFATYIVNAVITFLAIKKLPKLHVASDARKKKSK